jgi:hypothetical protein
MKVFSVIILSLCFTLDLFSQLSNNIENENNKIEGTVISRMSSIPIEGVEIYIDGLNENYYTNALGEFSIPYSATRFGLFLPILIILLKRYFMQEMVN